MQLLSRFGTALAIEVLEMVSSPLSDRDLPQHSSPDYQSVAIHYIGP
jgi:hypothetical protein